MKNKKLKHSFPMVFLQEEEEEQLQSTSLLQDLTSESNQAHISSNSQHKLHSSPLMSPKLVLSLTRTEALSDSLPSDHITIGHTAQLCQVDPPQSVLERGGGVGVLCCQIGKTSSLRINQDKHESRHCQRFCNTEVTVHGHHLCEKATLKCY